MVRALLVVLVVLVAAAGCGAGSGSPPDAAGPQGSCAAAASGECDEAFGLSAADVAGLEAGCPKSGQGVWSDGPCDRAGAVGSCRADQGGGYINVHWYSAPKWTLGNAKVDCEGRLGGAFSKP